MRHLALLLALPLCACTIIVQPHPPPNGGGPGLGGGLMPFSCSDTIDPHTITAHLIMNLRIGRTTANLAQDYARWVETTAIGLASAKIITTDAAIIRLDERPVMQPLLGAWGCQGDDPQKFLPEDVIQYYATGPDLPSSPVGCATDPLVSEGAKLPLVTEYPPPLNGRSGWQVFAQAPSIAIVIHIDDQERRSAFTDPACDSAKRLFDRDPAGDATWLQYTDHALPSDRIVHWFVTTDELVDRKTFVDDCKRYEGFPVQALDLIDPSDRALYGPLGDAIDGQGAGHVARLPLCAALSQTEFNKFLVKEIHSVAGIVGAPVDDMALKRVLDGQGIPGLTGGSKISGP